MKKATAALAVLAAAVVAQQTRKEITGPSTPHDDSKPNSAERAGCDAINGKFERIVTLRFKYQADLLAGMEKMVKEQKIKNAVILSA